MRYRELGKTGLKVSEIGLGAEWLERHNAEEVKAVIDCCEAQGINILDCWMAEPNVRSNIGAAIAGKRERWIIQGHFGSTWQDGQYVRTRDMEKVKPAFEDLLSRLGTDYLDLGMIHFVDEEAEFHRIMDGAFFAYVKEQKAKGVIRHIGLSTHNPKVGVLAAQSGEMRSRCSCSASIRRLICSRPARTSIPILRPTMRSTWGESIRTGRGSTRYVSSWELASQ